jgi:translation initiation factor 1
VLKPGHQIPDDGVIRVAKERRRAGIVTIVHGLPTSDLTEVGKLLRRSCGTGGTAKGGVLELQGDHRERVAAFFETQGRRVKRVGG